ncbi:class I SAM-dependent methyltransferase [Candidatus Pelagibacter sp.]|nr:class I SAM-dependent methyltransferase [Candidatus Pelagibacter sp.]MDA9743480.1 class I SAM-dependent methyltransferase [Candidatus Pelagibacter sp.]
MDKNILNRQSQHWETNFSNKPEMFGLEPSLPAKKALNIFKKNNCSKIVELGAGLGRDSIYFGKNLINVTALDYSKNGIKVINEKIKKENLTSSISTLKFDIREDLPFESNSVDACYSHMLYCMALTQKDLDKLNSEIHRILKPGGINIYTVRNTDDGDYKKGIHRGEDLYEIDGFIIHFFSKDKILNLTSGFKNISIDYFEEGSFPRKLYFICNKKN